MPVFKLFKSDWQPKPCFSCIGYTIDTYSGLICATDSRIGKLSSELVDTCVALFTLRGLPPLSVNVSLFPSCGAVTQIMTRYLHFIVNSQIFKSPNVCKSVPYMVASHVGEYGDFGELLSNH